MTTATLSHVHASPLKPCAWAPRTNSSGNLARWSSLRRDGAPGGGLCLKPSTPSSLARFIHWLTAPSLTPKASAICACFQPRSFSSKARKRLPSRQSLAWLDNVFSIVGFVIPMSLDLYAEICNSNRYVLWCWIGMQDLVSSWIHRRCYRVSHGARKRQARCGRTARPQAMDAQRVRREDRLGMARAAGSPPHACAYHSSVHLAAERSPE